MIIEEKMRILALFFAKSRVDGNPYLGKLFFLDDYWTEIYDSSKGRLSFEAATVLSNEAVIAKVLSDDYVR